MIIPSRRLAGPVLLVGASLLLAGCGYGGQGSSTRLLDRRLQVELAADVAANRATLEELPDGARVTLLDPSLFPNGGRATDDKYPDIRASVIEALLDPSLMRVQVADTSALPDYQRAMRVRNVVGYFADNGLALVLRQEDPPLADPAGAPAGLTITIGVVCPPAHGGWGYGTGQVDPACF